MDNIRIAHNLETTPVHTVDLENFSVKKLRKAHTLTKLKHTRYFTLSNNLYIHVSSFHTTDLCKPNVTIRCTRLKRVLRFIT